jgi:hypothetical protein
VTWSCENHHRNFSSTSLETFWPHVLQLPRRFDVAPRIILWRRAWVDVFAFCTFLSGLHPQIYLVDSITRNRLNRRYQAAGVVYLDNSRVNLRGIHDVCSF